MKKPQQRVESLKGFIVDLHNFKDEGAITIHSKRYFPKDYRYIPCTVSFKLPTPKNIK